MQLIEDIGFNWMWPGLVSQIEIRIEFDYYYNLSMIFPFFLPTSLLISIICLYLVDFRHILCAR